MKDIIKPIAVLGAICLVVTALLAYINSVTSPIILAAEQKAAEEARLEVMPEANSFEKIDSELPEGVTEAYLADNGGYVFMLTTKGYGGDIKLEDDYSQVDSVTGATISSKAYKKALGNAFAAYDQLTKEAK